MRSKYLTSLLPMVMPSRWIYTPLLTSASCICLGLMQKHLLGSSRSLGGGSLHQRDPTHIITVIDFDRDSLGPRVQGRSWEG